MWVNEPVEEQHAWTAVDFQPRNLDGTGWRGEEGKGKMVSQSDKAREKVFPTKEEEATPKQRGLCREKTRHVFLPLLAKAKRCHWTLSFPLGLKREEAKMLQVLNSHQEPPVVGASRISLNSSPPNTVTPHSNITTPCISLDNQFPGVWNSSTHGFFSRVPASTSPALSLHDMATCFVFDPGTREPLVAQGQPLSSNMDAVLKGLVLARLLCSIFSRDIGIHIRTYIHRRVICCVGPRQTVWARNASTVKTAMPPPSLDQRRLVSPSTFRTLHSQASRLALQCFLSPLHKNVEETSTPTTISANRAGAIDYTKRGHRRSRKRASQHCNKRPPLNCPNSAAGDSPRYGHEGRMMNGNVKSGHGSCETSPDHPVSWLQSPIARQRLFALSPLSSMSTQECEGRPSKRQARPDTHIRRPVLHERNDWRSGEKHRIRLDLRIVISNIPGGKGGGTSNAAHIDGSGQEATGTAFLVLTTRSFQIQPRFSSQIVGFPPSLHRASTHTRFSFSSVSTWFFSRGQVGQSFVLVAWFLLAPVTL
ncbi:uncharacterized protein CLUP02_09119 [Colletotrichum lupini]|uniref:Uncharacterized protein n=1 Tax=Colletotrichum lupini TaxID=145971 RepID=A0A9Q8SU30_9PEZI|nr:uncharacterized protein CLUP02_09119 [Colletotrichum lupini]UQC83624.1 hypothetical protein CLUP02_09119 [Colletotrichum lupini]